MGADEALNAMIATDLAEYFGRGHVFQLPVTDGRAADFYTRVPVLFDDSATHEQLLARIEAGGEITVAEATGGNGGTDVGARRCDGDADGRLHTRQGPAIPRRRSPPPTGHH